MNRFTLIAAALSSVLVSLAGAQVPKGSFTLVKHSVTTLSEKAIESADRKGSGSPSRDHKSLQFRSQNPSLVVHTGPEDDMLSYRIQGLRNPTLVVKPGAVLHILFANTDEDMFHDMRFGSVQPPFDLSPSTAASIGSDQLPHQVENKVRADSMVIKVPATPGIYTYFCSVKGHAKGGMFGQVVVK